MLVQVVMVGATGRHAHFVLAQLVARGVAVRALVRTEESAALARTNGASDTVIADLNEPESLDAAVAGMEGVFHIGPAFAPGEAAMGVAMVDAARRAGVRKFVYSGVIHSPITAMVNHAAAKLPVEEALYSSELDFTVLQPAVFMQNFEAFWPDVMEHGRLSQPYSLSSKMCWVDYRDVAEVVAMAMTGDELSYGTFELCAPGNLDSYELAEILSGVLGRPITAARLSADQFTSLLPQGTFQDGMTRMLDHYDRHGLPGGNALVLRAILGREPRTIRDYFRELAAR
jgi:uncharacterized protein YbjT (DUF2867 family)